MCHCSACQRRTGSSFGVAVFFASEATAETGSATTYKRSGLTATAFGCFDDKRDLEPTQAVCD
ncbi:GFA family protein [Agrobacterium vitis]|uniref:GFA family protein n=1 Tax=Agrobacterium vitis TaxID=373 RepID=UPI003080C06A